MKNDCLFMFRPFHFILLFSFVFCFLKRCESVDSIRKSLMNWMGILCYEHFQSNPLKYFVMSLSIVYLISIRNDVIHYYKINVNGTFFPQMGIILTCFFLQLIPICIPNLFIRYRREFSYKIHKWSKFMLKISGLGH